MAKVKVKDQIHWHYVTRGAVAPAPLWSITVPVLTPPLPNPLTFKITVTGCPCPPNTLTIVAYLTDDDDDQTYATISPPPSPYTVTFPEMPPGNYTLCVQAQCDSDIKNQAQDITLP